MSNRVYVNGLEAPLKALGDAASDVRRLCTAEPLSALQSPKADPKSECSKAISTFGKKIVTFQAQLSALIAGKFRDNGSTVKDGQEFCPDIYKNLNESTNPFTVDADAFVLAAAGCKSAAASLSLLPPVEPEQGIMGDVSELKITYTYNVGDGNVTRKAKLSNLDADIKAAVPGSDEDKVVQAKRAGVKEAAMKAAANAVFAEFQRFLNRASERLEMDSQAIVHSWYSETGRPRVTPSQESSPEKMIAGYQEFYLWVKIKIEQAALAKMNAYPSVQIDQRQDKEIMNTAALTEAIRMSESGELSGMPPVFDPKKPASENAYRLASWVKAQAAIKAISVDQVLEDAGLKSPTRKNEKSEALPMNAEELSAEIVEISANRPGADGKFNDIRKGLVAGEGGRGIGCDFEAGFKFLGVDDDNLSGSAFAAGEISIPISDSFQAFAGGGVSLGKPLEALAEKHQGPLIPAVNPKKFNISLDEAYGGVRFDNGSAKVTAKGGLLDNSVLGVSNWRKYGMSGLQRIGYAQFSQFNAGGAGIYLGASYSIKFNNGKGEFIPFGEMEYFGVSPSAGLQWDNGTDNRDTVHGDIGGELVGFVDDDKKHKLGVIVMGEFGRTSASKAGYIHAGGQYHYNPNGAVGVQISLLGASYLYNHNVSSGSDYGMVRGYFGVPISIKSILKEGVVTPYIAASYGTKAGVPVFGEKDMETGAGAGSVTRHFNDRIWNVSPGLTLKAGGWNGFGFEVTGFAVLGGRTQAFDAANMGTQHKSIYGGGLAGKLTYTPPSRKE